MSKLPFLLTRLDDDIPQRPEVFARLRKHLMRLRGHDIENDPILATWGAAPEAIPEHDCDRIQHRARAYVDRVRAASGTMQLKREEKERLMPVKDCVQAMSVETEAAWHAMRRCAQDGDPAFRLPPMLLIEPPGIGKSHWARALGSRP